MPPSSRPSGALPPSTLEVVLLKAGFGLWLLQPELYSLIDVFSKLKFELSDGNVVKQMVLL